MAHQLDNAIDETTRLANLVNDLLQLARTEQHLERTAVDLIQIVRDRVDIWTDADKARALERFRRSGASTDGTGLGLAIAEAIVKSSGGEFRLSNNTPTGLIASIEISVAPQPSDRQVNAVRRGLQRAEPPSPVTASNSHR